MSADQDEIILVAPIQKTEPYFTVIKKSNALKLSRALSDLYLSQEMPGGYEPSEIPGIKGLMSLLGETACKNESGLETVVSDRRLENFLRTKFGQVAFTDLTDLYYQCGAVDIAKLAITGGGSADIIEASLKAYWNELKYFGLLNKEKHLLSEQDVRYVTLAYLAMYGLAWYNRDVASFAETDEIRYKALDAGLYALEQIRDHHMDRLGGMHRHEIEDTVERLKTHKPKGPSFEPAAIAGYLPAPQMAGLLSAPAETMFLSRYIQHAFVPAMNHGGDALVRRD